MKKLLFGLLIAFFLLGSACAEGENLLSNGGFENVNASGMPDDWYTVAYTDAAGITQFTITDERAHSGAYSAKIVNTDLNDARFVTYIRVEPESVYRVSGYILVTEMGDTGGGANFALENLYAVSDSVFTTDGEWKYVEWYGETDTGQTSVELGVRVGGYSSESKGTAYFDDITVEKVQSVPDNVYPTLWFHTQSAGDSLQSDALAEEDSQKSTGLFIVLGLLFIGFSAYGARLLPENGATRNGKPQAVVGVFALLLMAAFALRLVLAGSVSGYGVDIGCFSAWSQRMAAVGPLNFYTPDYFCDYPPGYMLLLWPVGQMISAIGNSSSAGVLILIKIIPILCDMQTAILLFSFAKKRMSIKAAAFIGLFFAFNPAVLVTGSAWGQVDSLLSLALAAAAISAAEKKWRVALPVYVLAILIKPQALLFAPVALVWLAASFLFDTKDGRKPQWKQLWQGAVLAVIAAAAVVLPFQIKQADSLWLVKLYRQTLSSYNYAVLNTANLAYLLGGNWSPLSEETGGYIKTLSAWLPAGTGLALLTLGLWKLDILRGFKGMRTRAKALWQGLLRREAGTDEGRKLALAALCAAFGIAFLLSALWPSSFMVYGTVWMVFAYLAVILLIVVERRADALPFYMALMMIGVYVLGLKIHERYLFAACALLPIAYAGTRDRRLLWLCAGLSATTFINTAIVLDNSILFGAAMGHLNADTGAVNALLSIANLLLCGYAAVIAFTGLKPSGPIQSPAFKPFADKDLHRERLLRPKDARLHLNARDALIMGVTFMVYCAVAFVNLGSTKAPQTSWVFSGGDQAVFELEEESTFKLLYYAGVSYHNFTVSVSSDGETWSDPTICRMRQGLCYRWMYVTPALVNDISTEEFAIDSEANIVWFTGKYLRINAEISGLNLWEIVLRDEYGDRLPVTLASYSSANGALNPGATPENLIDEQDTITGEPGWFNGTYFDEIYHARTAYEHLHWLAPYETSHPPLGKEIMSVGIAIFGMTPFGWRFMGALFGALMLPAMYLFGMQLTGKRKFAAFAMMLMSLDLMHFTQTRIATIDSFPTLFIILSYLSMARYILSDPFAAPDGEPRLWTRAYVRSLVPLLLSGVFIGCAIAAKWIGLYAGAGLAVLLFYGVYRQFRSGLSAFDLNTDRLKRQEAARVDAAKKLLLKRIFTTLGFCVLFFLVIPALIYYASYIPYLSPTGPVSLQRILQAQRGMLAYHSTPGLGMEHPFYSPWWQWPLILKPMWYNKDAFVAPGYGANIVCLGNPAVFYLGSLAMLAVFVMIYKNHFRREHTVRKRHYWLLYAAILASVVMINLFLLRSFSYSLTLSQARQYTTYFVALANLLLCIPIALFIRDQIRMRSKKDGIHYVLPQDTRPGETDQPALAIVAISFLAQYLPWVLVPRSMFIYHYFASLPFIILATMLVAMHVKGKKLQNGLMLGLLAAALVLFVMFYPYASGMTVSREYMTFLRWFPNLPV